MSSSGRKGKFYLPPGVASMHDYRRLQDMGWIDAEGERMSLAARQVALWWRRRAMGLDPEIYLDVPSIWVPAATHSRARLPIGGAKGPVLAVSPDQNCPAGCYEWYSLASVPISGAIYRVTENGTTVWFERVAFNQWLPNLMHLRGRR